MTRKAQFHLQRREYNSKVNTQWYGMKDTYGKWITLAKTDEFPELPKAIGLYQWRITLRGEVVACNMGDSWGWRVNPVYETKPTV